MSLSLATSGKNLVARDQDKFGQMTYVGLSASISHVLICEGGGILSEVEGRNWKTYRIEGADGGTGRHASLRSLWRNPWRFESSSAHSVLCDVGACGLEAWRAHPVGDSPPRIVADGSEPGRPQPGLGPRRGASPLPPTILIFLQGKG